MVTFQGIEPKKKSVLSLELVSLRSEKKNQATPPKQGLGTSLGLFSKFPTRTPSFLYGAPPTERRYCESNLKMSFTAYLIEE